MILFTKKNCSKILISIILIFPLISTAQIIYSESDNTPQSLRFDSYYVTEKQYNSKVTGSNYIFDEWQAADIYLANDSGVFQNVLIKLDVLYNAVEIKDIVETKVLPAYRVKYLKITNNNDIYITRNALGDFLINGFSKIIYNGKASLLCNYAGKIKEAKYNEALAVGNRDDELIIVKKYYFFIKNELILVEKNKRKFIKSFSNNPKIQEFIKEKKISPKDENDLIKLITYIDSLT